jgi:phospholipase D1/2
MGWSDVALCLSGPVVQDLQTHFSQRWNFIYDEKYGKKATRYSRLPDTYAAPNENRGVEGGDEGERGFGGEGAEGERGLFGHSGGLRQKLYSRVNEGYHQMEHQYGHGDSEAGAQRGGVDCQIARSSAKWSHNINTVVSGLTEESTAAWYSLKRLDRIFGTSWLSINLLEIYSTRYLRTLLTDLALDSKRVL